MRFSLRLVLGFAIAVSSWVNADQSIETVDAGWRVVPHRVSTPAQVGPEGTLWNNGPVNTHMGTGFNNADESWLQTGLGMQTMGFGHQVSIDNRVADDFTVPPGEVWVIDSIYFWAYMTNATPGTTPSAYNLRIWDGTPGGGGSMIWGDTTTNRLVDSWWYGTYRVQESTSGVATDRAIMMSEVIVGVSLGPGTYWLDWQSDGPPQYTGPWVPPVTVMGQTTTGNGLHGSGGAVYIPAIDPGTNTQQGFPFMLSGSLGVHNDSCSTAEVITCPPGGGAVTVYGDTTAATTTGTFSCGGTTLIDDEVWFRIPGTGGEISVTTCTGYNGWKTTDMLLFDGWCSGLNCVSAPMGSCPSTIGPDLDTITWSSNLGTDYYIAFVMGYPWTGEGLQEIESVENEYELVVTCEAVCQTLQTPTVDSVGGVGCGGTTPQTSPVLTWHDVANESGYNWEVRDAFGSVIRTGSTNTDVTSADLGALPAGSFSVRVQAFGDGINYCGSSWSQFCEFTIAEACEPLGTPVIIDAGGVECGGSTQATSPMLTWTDVANEIGYNWEVREPTGALITGGSTGENITSVNIGALVPASYRIRVQALGDGVFFCDGAWTEYCRIDILGECESLAAPAVAAVGDTTCGGSTFDTAPVLTWGDVENESGYSWRILDTSGSTLQDGVTGQNLTSVQIGPLDLGGYVAQVRATGDGVNFCDGDWSSSCPFEILGECESLAAPAISAVGDTTCGGSTFETAPVLTWGDVENESGYSWRILDSSGSTLQEGVTGQNLTTVQIGPLDLGGYVAQVRATGDGVNYCDGDWSSSCSFEILGEVGTADFIWWPMTPKRGQKVRFADRATGEPIGWFWEMDDGWSSTDRNPLHAYDSNGAFDVSMMCEYEHGTDTRIRSVSVEGVLRCGDEICEGEETAWSCPADCGLAPEETGRAGGRDRKPTVPAAVGGVGGSGGTFWTTEGWVVNPGDEPLTYVVEYTPLDSMEVFTVGPFDLEPRHGIFLENIVEDLFNVQGNGALWIDSASPVVFLTRSNNISSNGKYGQGVPGTRGRLTLARGDGLVYLIGLREDHKFRSNIFFQEIDGEWITVEIEVFDEYGTLLRRQNLDIEAHSNKLRNLRGLGAAGNDSVFVTVRVIDGGGRMAVIGSVVDNITGDPTTIDPIHLDQTLSRNAAGAGANQESHHLLAVVAHTHGAENSVWSSRFVINSPGDAEAQSVRVVYVPEYDRTGVVGDQLETIVSINGGEQLAWEDVLVDLFNLPSSAKTQGALHVYSSDPLLIDSRTYNERAGGGTLGQPIKALGSGDLIDLEHTGSIFGLSRTADARTNVGIAVFSDEETEVELRFFANFPAFRPLGIITRTVEARSHLQIGRVFEELGLSSQQLPSVSVSVKVRSGGAVYVYASNVDNASGDSATIHASRNN